MGKLLLCHALSPDPALGKLRPDIRRSTSAQLRSEFKIGLRYIRLCLKGKGKGKLIYELGLEFSSRAFA